MALNRIRWWLPTVLLINATAQSTEPTGFPGTPPSAQHSVVLVVVDALNKTHLGAYGYTRPTSPHLDKLAASGILFTNWLSVSSWTRPAMTTILTGLPKSEHRMELGENKLSAKINTLAERFKKAGFHTAAFIGNPLIGASWNYDQGFDHFIDTATIGPFPDGTQLIKPALSWLSAPHQGPFFAIIFLTDPHAPYNAPAEERIFSAAAHPPQNPPREVTAPLDPVTAQAIVNAYDDEVHHTDQVIGRLIEAIEAIPQKKRPHLVLTADHGEIFGEHNCFQHAYHMWRPVLEVPMIIKPATPFSRGVIDAPFNHLDLAPTLLALAGIGKQRGLSRTTIFTPPSATRIRTAGYDARGVKRQAALLGPWKLIWNGPVDRQRFQTISGEINLAPFPSLTATARFALYNLETDPQEKKNQLPKMDNARVVQTLKAAIQMAAPKETFRTGRRNNKKTGSSRRSPNGAIDKETLEALRAAGYIR